MSMILIKSVIAPWVGLERPLYFPSLKQGAGPCEDRNACFDRISYNRVKHKKLGLLFV